MIKAVRQTLILIGKPFYFLLSRLVLGLTIVFYSANKFNKKRKKSKSKTIYKGFSLPKLELPKLKFPKIKFPKIGKVLKLEELHINLLELQVLTKVRKFFEKLIKALHNRRFNFRLKSILPISLIILLVFSFYFLILRGLPSPHDLESREPQVSTKIYDRNGNLLYKIYKDQNRSIVPLTQIPIHVRQATLAAEDAEFYSHPGFSLKGIFRAIIQDLQTGSVQGGSTITQQLVKNTLLTPEKTITRKIKELILSVEVEASYTKDKILEMYLNEVSYGGTAYGIEEASQSYFGKNVQDLR